MNTYEINDRNEVIQYKLDDICKQRDEAYAMLRRIARKGEFMDMEGQRLVVFDWLARRHISSENDKCDTPRTHNENKLNAVTEQRDRLAEAMTRIKTIYENPEKRCIPSSSDMYDEALQSLTTNKEDQERKSPASDGSI